MNTPDHLRTWESPRVEVERVGLPHEQQLVDLREQYSDQEIHIDGSIDLVAADASRRDDAAEDHEPDMKCEEQPEGKVQCIDAIRKTGRKSSLVNAEPREW